MRRGSTNRRGDVHRPAYKTTLLTGSPNTSIKLDLMHYHYIATKKTNIKERKEMDAQSEDKSPLFETTVETPYMNRVYALVHLGLFVCFLVLRLFYGPIKQECYGVWIIALCCEAYFAFTWLLEHNLRWHKLTYKTHLQRFDQRYGGSNACKLPKVDVVITTANPKKEPTMVVVNTLISVLAVEYPVEKVACYVSDDAASPITFYSLLLSLEFSKKWVPFCKKYKLGIRAPSIYFSEGQDELSNDLDFIQELKVMKDEYEVLKKGIKTAMKTGKVPIIDSIPEESFAFTEAETSNHSSVVKVVHEHMEGCDNVPHIIYVAREKRPNVHHHYKAGAMNVMTRVSAIMTNADYMLNLDCDMFVNNPNVFRHVMCFFLDYKSEKDCGFVQYPQLYYLKEKAQESQLNIYERIFQGMNGMRLPIFCGTGAFMRRKAVYKISPEIKGFASWSFEEYKEKYGCSMDFLSSVKAVYNEEYISHISPSSKVAEALKISSSSYEENTLWGEKVGWLYGSVVEDLLSGMRIHCLGWKSKMHFVEDPGFLGSPPTSIAETQKQQRRWVGGLFQIFFSNSCPFLGIQRQLPIQARFMYAYFHLWGVWGILTLAYTMVPIYSLMTSKPSLPQTSEPTFLLGATIVLLCYMFRLWEYRCIGISIKVWWNVQKTWMISCLSSWFYGTLDGLKDVCKIKHLEFVVSSKGIGQEDAQSLDTPFSSSYFDIPPTTILLLIFVIVVKRFIDILTTDYGFWSVMLSECICCIWIVVNLWCYVQGLLRTGKQGLSWLVVGKSVLVTIVISLAFQCL